MLLHEYFMYEKITNQLMADPSEAGFTEPKRPHDDIEGKIFVGGLSWQTTESSLRFYFEKFGELSDAAIMIDKRTGQPRGFGFITMKDPAAAEIVVQTEHTIDGRLVDVKRAVPRDMAPTPSRSEARKVFVGGLAAEVTEKDFADYFSQFGTVKDAVVMVDRATNRSRGFGFITFESEESVESVLRMKNEIHGKWVEVKRAEPRDGPAGGGGQGGGSGGGMNDRGDMRGGMGGGQGMYGGGQGQPGQYGGYVGAPGGGRGQGKMDRQGMQGGRGGGMGGYAQMGQPMGAGGFPRPGMMPGAADYGAGAYNAQYMGGAVRNAGGMPGAYGGMRYAATGYASAPMNGGRAPYTTGAPTGGYSYPTAAGATNMGYYGAAGGAYQPAYGAAQGQQPAATGYASSAVGGSQPYGQTPGGYNVGGRTSEGNENEYNAAGGARPADGSSGYPSGAAAGGANTYGYAGAGMAGYATAYGSYNSGGGQPNNNINMQQVNRANSGSGGVIIDDAAYRQQQQQQGAAVSNISNANRPAGGVMTAAGGGVTMDRRPY